MRYHFGIHYRDCTVRPSLMLLRQDSDAEMKGTWAVRWGLSSEISVSTRTLGCRRQGTCPALWIEPKRLQLAPFISVSLSPLWASWVRIHLLLDTTAGCTMCIEHLAVRAPVAQELMFPLAQSMEKNFFHSGSAEDIHGAEKHVDFIPQFFP